MIITGKASKNVGKAGITKIITGVRKEKQFVTDEMGFQIFSLKKAAFFMNRQNPMNHRFSLVFPVKTGSAGFWPVLWMSGYVGCPDRMTDRFPVEPVEPVGPVLTTMVGPVRPKTRPMVGPIIVSNRMTH